MNYRFLGSGNSEKFWFDDFKIFDAMESLKNIGDAVVRVTRKLSFKLVDHKLAINSAFVGGRDN